MITRICRDDAGIRFMVRIGITVAIGFTAAFVHGAVTVTPLVSFTGTNGSFLGANPYGKLVQAVDGNFYGVTQLGGTSNLGTAFRVTSDGSFSNLVSFTGTNGDFPGANPFGGLVQSTDWNLYGTTRNGGSNNLGTVFRIATNGVFTSLISFNGANGSAPLTELLQAADGYLYGTTFTGGANNKGSVFQMTTNGALTNLISFTGSTAGNGPEAALVQAQDGGLYGTTWAGGNLFRATTSGTFSNLLVFGTGVQPRGKLVQGADGLLYGTTYAGGAFNKGMVYWISTNGFWGSLLDFNSTNGWNPYGGVIFGKDGNLYGVTTIGGHVGGGVIFQLSIQGKYTFLYTFDTGSSCSCLPAGALPYASLLQGVDGNFYGTAEVGGANGYGTVFRFSLQPVFQSVAQTNGALVLNWNGVTNKNYQLQFVTNVLSTNWGNVGSVIVATNDTMTTAAPASPDSSRFYRLMMSP